MEKFVIAREIDLSLRDLPLARRGNPQKYRHTERSEVSTLANSKSKANRLL